MSSSSSDKRRKQQEQGKEAVEYSSIASGLFEPADVPGAVDALREAGFRLREIGMLSIDAGPAPDDATPDTTQRKRAVKDSAVGSAGGRVVGGLVGAIAGSVVPGIGTLTCAGFCASAAGSGGTMLGLLQAAGVSEDEADYYREKFAAGAMMVLVNAGQRLQHALDALNRAGATKIDYEPVRPNDPSQGSVAAS